MGITKIFEISQEFFENIDFSCNKHANLKNISFPEIPPETPKNRFYFPQSPRNVKLPFLDSQISRGVKCSEELPSLAGC